MSETKTYNPQTEVLNSQISHGDFVPGVGVSAYIPETAPNTLLKDTNFTPETGNIEPQIVTTGLEAGKLAMKTMMDQMGAETPESEAAAPSTEKDGAMEASTVEASYETPKRWEIYTPEKNTEVTRPFIDAMAERFNVNPEDFLTLETKDENGNIVPLVVYSGSKMDMAWKDVFNKKSNEKFVIDVNGEQYDTRDGMTKENFEIYANDAQVPEPVPNDDSGRYETTFLTGDVEKRKRFNFGANFGQDVPIGRRFSDGSPHMVEDTKVTSRYYGGQVRPAVIVK